LYARDRLLHTRLVRYVDGQSNGMVAQGCDHIGRLLNLIGRTSCHGNRRSRVGEGKGDLASDSTAAARHYRHLIRQVESAIDHTGIARAS
jgi:hypothetical protein